MKTEMILLAAIASVTPALGAPLHRGGTLRLTADSAFGSIDPQINYALGFEQVFQVVYDGLVSFRKVGGLSSNDVVPDLADAMPKPQDGGLTYVFHLRPGIRFSNGRLVTVADVVETMRRNFRLAGPGVPFYSTIVGADACTTHPAGCMLSGVVGDDAAGTVTFHLVRPDPEFFDKLALPFASVVPADTPDHDIGNTATPATGAYMIAGYEPNRHMTLVRNPHFHQWDDQAQPDGYVDRIEYDFGLSDEAEVTAVENGQYDWMYDDKPTDRLGELGAHFARRTYVDSVPAIYYVPMNVNLYPFDHLKARQAVDYAIDRYAITIIHGGPGSGTPLCQTLPRNIPGRVDYCPFTRGADTDHPAAVWRAPDLARARALVTESGTSGANVTLVVPNNEVEFAMGTYIQSVLNRIGYHASVRALDFNIQFTYIQNTNNKVQISVTDWGADYPAASDFLRILYGCASFHPGSDSSINVSGYCDKALDALMARASDISVTDPRAGDALWAEADRRVTDLALSANLMQRNWIDLCSSRLGNYQFSQISRMLFAKAWVQ
jgi:peptide/nickel transport system substrate-binding protein